MMPLQEDQCHITALLKTMYPNFMVIEPTWLKRGDIIWYSYFTTFRFQNTPSFCDTCYSNLCQLTAFSQLLSFLHPCPAGVPKELRAWRDMDWTRSRTKGWSMSIACPAADLWPLGWKFAHWTSWTWMRYVKNHRSTYYIHAYKDHWKNRPHC